MPVVAVTEMDVGRLKEWGVRLLAAVGGSGATAVQDADFAGSCALMIGNEGRGLAEEWIEMCDVRVTVPCPGAVESLNAAVAGSLLLYEASRQRGEQTQEEKQKRNAGVHRSAQVDRRATIETMRTERVVR